MLGPIPIDDIPDGIVNFMFSLDEFSLLNPSFSDLTASFPGEDVGSFPTFAFNLPIIALKFHEVDNTDADAGFSRGEITIKDEIDVNIRQMPQDGPQLLKCEFLILFPAQIIP
ncbi:hypothetical protein KSF_076440 [Reticulibacter mediterranei]|uniref:Uncharacterized protein n=1 Tax=Reticulibacter mediterranei TaxID=2778369 RepID=A0A8J3IYK8_9CHLR|nr:hypothetical protein KSF_076440 [Reticulibacter mediterranei]